jgi:hypothetical protein
MGHLTPEALEPYLASAFVLILALVVCLAFSLRRPS